MEIKDIERECITRQGELSQLEQRIVALEKRIAKIETTFAKITFYAFVTISSIIGFFIKNYIGGIPK